MRWRRTGSNPCPCVERGSLWLAVLQQEVPARPANRPSAATHGQSSVRAFVRGVHALPLQCNWSRSWGALQTRSPAPRRPHVHGRHRLHRAEREWRLNPKGPTESPIEDGVLVARPGRPAAAAPRADEAEHRMIVRKRRNGCGSRTTGASLNGSGRNEPTSMATNTWQFAPLNEPPDR